MANLGCLIAVSAAFVFGSAANSDELSRRLGAISGAALADAAAMPLHWIYNTATISSKLAAGADAAFFSPPSCPFYNYSEGENTPYGQQNRVILAALAAEGHMNATTIQDRYWSYYGPAGAPCSSGCYLDGSTKGFLSNYKAGLRWPHVGANDSQGNAIVHMVPLVAALAGIPGSRMLEQVESLIRVTQNNDQAVAQGLAGARILSKVIEGQTLLDSVKAVAEELQDATRHNPKKEDAFLAKGLRKVLSQLDQPNFDVVNEFGQSCDYPFGLWIGSHLAAQLSPAATLNGTQAFMLAVRQTIEAGGDSGSRSGFVGALFGAAAGEAALPSAWKAKYLHYSQVLGNAQSLLNAHPVTKLVLYA